MKNIPITKSKLGNILDLSLLENYVNQLYEYIQVPITLFDSEGEVLFASPWTKLCSDYIRKNVMMGHICKTVCTAPGVQDPDPFTCPNGLMMYKVAIKVKEDTVAYLVLSQFLMQGMDIKEIEDRLHEIPLEERQIASVIKNIPILDCETINTAISFINNFVFLLHDMIGRRVQVMELEEEILHGYEELEASYQDISALNYRLSLVNNDLLIKNELVKQSRRKYKDLVKQKLNSQKKQMWDMVSVMGKLVESRDLYTSDHQKKVAILATSIAMYLKLDRTRIESIFIASLLHDIGKIGIPSELLSKPDKLTYIEYSLMKTHAEKGAEILKEVSFDMPISEIVMQHHEKIDGSGYPAGLTGKDMLLESKIIAVADVYDAITSHRPYRPSLGIEYAKQHLIEERGILYDAEVVDACIHVSKNTLWTIDNLYTFLYEDDDIASDEDID